MARERGVRSPQSSRRCASPRRDARLVHLGSAAEYAETPGEHDRRGGSARRVDAVRRFKARGLQAGERGGRVGPRHGRCPRLQSDWSPDAADVPAGTRRETHPGRSGRGHQTIELGPLGAVRDYVDLRDIATAVQILASEASLAHRDYNVGSGRPTVVRDLVSMIAERLEFSGRGPRIIGRISAFARREQPGGRHHSHACHGMDAERRARRVGRRARRQPRRRVEPMSRTRLLLVSMYPLDAGLWGPTARITRLRDELARLVNLDVIDGYRAQRRPRLWRYALEGRMRGLDGIYVESSTFLPAESDLAFLGLSRALGIPVVTLRPGRLPALPRVLPARHAEAPAGGGSVSAGDARVGRRLEPPGLSHDGPGGGGAGSGRGGRPPSAGRATAHRRAAQPDGEPDPVRRGCSAAGTWRRSVDLRGRRSHGDRAWISSSTSSAARARIRALRTHAGSTCTAPRAPRFMRCFPRSSPRRSRGLGTDTTTSRCRSSCSTICPTAAQSW